MGAAIDRGIVVYLHTVRFAEAVPADATRRPQNLELGPGSVSVHLVHPSEGTASTRQGLAHGGQLVVELPAFHEDIAAHIVCAK